MHFLDEPSSQYSIVGQVGVHYKEIHHHHFVGGATPTITGDGGYGPLKEKGVSCEPYESVVVGLQPLWADIQLLKSR